MMLVEGKRMVGMIVGREGKGVLCIALYEQGAVVWAVVWVQVVCGGVVVKEWVHLSLGTYQDDCRTHR